jgi:hypothetical protein
MSFGPALALHQSNYLIQVQDPRRDGPGMVDAALARPDGTFEAIYAAIGRPSIPQLQLQLQLEAADAMAHNLDPKVALPSLASSSNSRFRRIPSHSQDVPPARPEPSFDRGGDTRADRDDEIREIWRVDSRSI